MMASNLPFNVKNDKIFWGKESPLTPLILHFHFMYTPPPPKAIMYLPYPRRQVTSRIP